MDDKDYKNALAEMPGSRWNDIIRAVNNKVPKEKAGIKTDAEAKLYDSMMAEADSLEKRGGVRPIFDNVEIESDDPSLDIYSDEV